MNDIALKKENLRKIFLKKRQEISNNLRDNLFCDIAKNFELFLSKNNIFIAEKIFASYIPTKFEVNPTYIEKFLVKNNCQICYPKIQKNNKVLKFLKPYTALDFKPNNVFTKIIEPTFGEFLIPDFILTPLVAFDKQKNRLGMGKGFYDASIREYKNLNSQLITIGLAFDTQLSSEDLPELEMDSRLDFIITSSTIIS